MSDQPERLVNRLVGACFGALIGAMALYGAVQLIGSIWLPLCIGLAVVGGVGAVGWLLVQGRRRW